ncbi:MAG: type IV toxin-antitoxin system AbiEi family antitoxin domain-containing protein [Solirubrobacteraceae bacterium]
MPDVDWIPGPGDPQLNRRREVALAELAGRQFGVVSRGQLLGLGFSPDQIRGRLRRGLLHRVHRDVYAVGHRRLVPHARLVAALLTCGPAAFLSHRIAAAVWGLREINVRHIEVTVPGASAPVRAELVMHRTTNRPHPADISSRNGLRVSSVPRLLIELAATETPVELDRLITEAVRRRILNLEALEAALKRHSRWPGLARLKPALRAYRPRRDRKSDLERAFDRLITETDVPPPQRNVIVHGWELDCYWPGAKLAVELDGRPYHVAVRDTERDKIKDANLLRHGINVLRITDLRLELDAPGVLDDVRALTRPQHPAT